MKTILVLGGTGFFGKCLVEKLLISGHKVSIGTRGNEKPFKDVEYIVLDRFNAESMNAALKGKEFDLVYDQLNFSSNDSKILLDSLDGRIKHFVITSTCFVYDAGINQKEEVQDTKNLELKMGSFKMDGSGDFSYQEGKRQTETYCLNNSTTPMTFLRFPLVLGEDDPTGRLNWHLKRILKGEEIFFPNLDAISNFVASEDAGDALFHLGTKNIEGIFNIESETLSLKQLLGFMEDTCGKKAQLAKTETEGTLSPYGYSETTSMNCNKLRSTGFSAKVKMKNLINTLAKSLNQ